MRKASIAAVLTLALAAAFVPAQAAAPPYLVGAAATDISPYRWGTINKGGFGFGDGSSIVSQQLGPGGTGKMEKEHIAARAVVIQDARTRVAVSFVTVETQGMFAAYENDPADGLYAIEQRVAARIPALPASNIVIANDHTHSGPDAIGVWGFIPRDYLDYIANQIVAAIVTAYNARRPATIVAGADDAPDMIYNQTCTEALNQDETSNLPNNVCDPFEESKDSW